MAINNMLMWSSNWCFYLNTNICNVLHSGEKNTDCDYFMSTGEVDHKLNNRHSNHYTNCSRERNRSLTTFRRAVSVL